MSSAHKGLLIILFAFLVIPRVQSQKETVEWEYIQIDSTKQMWGDWAQPEWLRYFGLDAGDVDNDGYLDIVSGRYIYHNPGMLMDGEWKRTALDDNVDGIFIMDLDGDPLADIIAMALPDLFWYEAIDLEGTKYQKTAIGQVPATSHVNSQGFEKTKLIGEHPQFVIAGAGDIYLVEYRTSDTGAEWAINLIGRDTSDEGIGIGDLDGDGDMDLAAGRRPKDADEPTILVWFENPGHSDEEWKVTVVGNSEHPIDRVAVADFNDDGQAEIVVTEERYPGEEPDANLWLFEKQSNGDWDQKKVVAQYSMNNLDVADFDNDGDFDLLTAEHKGKALELQLWMNDGKANFEKKPIDTGKENHLGTQFFDLDADGDLDVIGAGWDFHKFMHVWRNDKIKTLKTGMLFKEYPWTPGAVSDDGKFLRVGGKLDYKINEDHFPKKNHNNGFIPLEHSVDLNNAVAAEVLVERVQSHEDTKNLSIQFNHGPAVQLFEPPLIPQKATDYMFHSTIRVPIPTTSLRSGANNSFKLTVDEDQSWSWPQNLVYGVVLRIYYQSNTESKPIAKIAAADSGQKLGASVRLQLESDQMEKISNVQYIAHFEDVNTQGDGKYRQWQYRYHRSKLQDNLGTADNPPFTYSWNTEWVPDQKYPIALTALVTDTSGFIHVLPTVENLFLDRNHNIELVKPFGQDPFWTTRNGIHDQNFFLPGEVENKWEAHLYWNSWSPCYVNGIELNGKDIGDMGDLPCYDAYWHVVPVAEKLFQNGTNSLVTTQTPKHNGQMVHGMDVQWPGIMAKVKYGSTNKNKVTIAETSYEKRPHFVVYTANATYYYDKAGGGFSRLIDKNGNDWISYKTEPWNQYPESAASSYRGIPNMVFGSAESAGAGHPGHDQCISELSDKNSILTKSKNGKWQWLWTFENDHAVMDVQKTAEDTPFWFLYEGTPGGAYHPDKTVYGTDVLGLKRDMPDFYKQKNVVGNFRWAYFNKRGQNHLFYLGQVNEDDKDDLFGYLGNTTQGANSQDGMVVFGFGRGVKTEPLLVDKLKFVIGFHEKSSASTSMEDYHQTASKYITEVLNSYNQNATEQ